MTRELPILFSGPLVRAILAGAKTQTRRPARMVFDGETTGDGYTTCGWEPAPAPIRVSDRLYVRETFAPNLGTAGGYLYRADYGEAAGCTVWDLRAGGRPTHHTDRWRPSIHMPKAAARIWLEVTRVRVQRVRDITEGDAQAEGYEPIPVHGAWAGPRELGGHWSARKPFQDAWTSIYGSESWEHGYCWVYDFKRVDGGAP